MLTFEEFFVAKMKYLSSAIDWTFADHFPGYDPKHVASWQKDYQAWIDSGCPPFSPNKPTVQQKKPIRYLNRVNA